MKVMNKRILFAMAITALLVFLLGCGGFAEKITSLLEEKSTPLPTRTPWPTFTPTPQGVPISGQPIVIPTSTPTLTPTPTPVPPTPTPTPVPRPLVAVKADLNVRGGPGTSYKVVGKASPGPTTEVIGRNEDSSWLKIVFPDASDGSGTGWVKADLVDMDGTLDAVPVAEIPPTPVPVAAAPAPTQAPTAAPSDGGGDGGDGGGGGETLTGVQACFAQGYQFCPDAWYAGEPNEAMVQFRGTLKDYRTGGAVSGWHLLVRCGTFESMSFSTGPSSSNPDYPPGKIDWMKIPAIYCDWNVAIVRYECPHYFNAECKEYTILSPVVPVRTDPSKGETIVVMDWLCNSEKFDCNGPSSGR